jgi:hypothetical protein
MVIILKLYLGIKPSASDMKFSKKVVPDSEQIVSAPTTHCIVLSLKIKH